ncbi:MAG: Transglutaminase-like superfamily protein [Firmicutes bacterium ADurb.Bin456]|nr:MAG: Transglutaminase-like superfamily protein [Firmicutes bacterium ADurb.Bin456]
MNDYLKPGFYVDTSPKVLEFARKHGKGNTPGEKAVSLFFAVRDGFRYDPYNVVFTPDEFKASVRITKDSGFCIHKAIILAAVLRAAGIPSRLAFADVKNHLNTRRLRDLVQTDVFYYHGITELYLDGRWLKVTPAFNIELCEKFGVRPLDFDGTADCIFHQYDIKGNKHMEYLKFRGSYADFPYELVHRDYQRFYPHIFAPGGIACTGDFAREAEEENR